MEYANVVCHPRFKKDMEKLERVQRRATKLVPGFSKMPYENRLKAMKLPSLVRYPLWYIEDTGEIWLKSTSTYMECIPYHMTVYYRKLRHVHWEDITTSWSRDTATPSWDFSSFPSVSPIYGIISRQKWCLHHRWMHSREDWTNSGTTVSTHWSQRYS